MYRSTAQRTNVIFAIAALFVTVGLSACGSDDADIDTESSYIQPAFGDRDIVVYWTLDTFGNAAATEGAWCQRLQSIFGEFGESVACVDGGVSPSTWTAEAHVRMLYPDYTHDEKRDLMKPHCDDESVLVLAAEHLQSDYYIGLENEVFGVVGAKEGCSEGESNTWFQGAQSALLADSASSIAEGSDDPVGDTIDLIGQKVLAGEPVVAFLNDFQIGGHVPRCWFDPYLGGCDEAWDLAVELDLESIDGDRSFVWFTGLWARLSPVLMDHFKGEEFKGREIAWKTIMQSVRHFGPERFDPRLRELLAKVETADRFDDLVLVIVGDHGEAPCVEIPFAGGEMECQHGLDPNEWITLVPTYIYPPEAAEKWAENGLIGDARQRWSTTNLSYGISWEVGLAKPNNWPAFEPAGYATSWTCREEPRGVRIGDGVALRCSDGRCGFTDYLLPKSYAHRSMFISTVPPEIAAYAPATPGGSSWFDVACGE